MDNLFILLLIPVLGALALVFVKETRTAKQFALLISLVSLVLTVPFLATFVPEARMQFEPPVAWIPALGLPFHIGIGGISLPLVLLTNGLVPLIVLATFRQTSRGGFYARVLFMQGGLLLVFTALGAFAFYV